MTPSEDDNIDPIAESNTPDDAGSERSKSGDVLLI